MPNQKYGVEIRTKFLTLYKNWIDFKRKLRNNETRTNNAGKHATDYKKSEESEILEFE